MGEEGVLLCPECGGAAKSERALRRTRRRWRWALVGLIALPGAYLTWSAPRVARAGWVGLAPTTALIWWVGEYEAPEVYANQTMSKPTGWAEELARRFDNEEMWAWQFRWMMLRLDAVYARERWPRGQAYLVSTGVPTWLQTQSRFAFVSDLPTAQRGMPDHMFAWEAGQLTGDVTDVGIVITGGAYQTRFVTRVTLVDRAEDAVEMVADAELTKAVKRALRGGVRPDKNATTETSHMLGFHLYRKEGPIAPDLGVGMSVDFLYDGETRATFSLCPLESAYGDPVDWLRINAPDPGWIETDPESMARWTVRIRGDANVALRDAKRRRFWGGEYTAPLKDFILK